MKEVRIMSIPVIIKWDNEASVYYAVSDEIGLALESESYDKLVEKVKNAIPELVQLNHIQNFDTIRICTEERQVAYV